MSATRDATVCHWCRDKFEQGQVRYVIDDAIEASPCWEQVSICGQCWENYEVFEAGLCRLRRAHDNFRRALSSKQALSLSLAQPRLLKRMSPASKAQVAAALDQ